MAAQQVLPLSLNKKDEVEGLRRRDVLKMGAAVVGCSLFTKIPLAAAHASGCVRIRPIPGTTYSPSFLAYIERARFKNPRDAIASVRDSKIAYDLVWE